MKTTYAYDEKSQLRELLHTDKEGILDHYTYEYDLLGNKTGITKERRGLEEESGAYTYGYDALERLSSIHKDGIRQTRYTYDAFGNRTGKEEQGTQIRYRYNSLNQLVSQTDQNADGSVSREIYSYDRRGNLSQILKDGQVKNQYVYGAINRLEQAVNGSGAKANYLYNGLGHRVGKQEAENQEPMKRISYLIDLTKEYHNLLDKTEDTNIQTYFWDGNVALYEENGRRNYYLQDDLGSPIRIEGEDGTLRETYGYGAFGEDLYGTQERIQPFGYTGYQRDSIAGTYYAQAREYNAGAGRFTGQDIIAGVIEQPFSMNRYTYCFNTPMVLVDLNGLTPEKYTYDREDAIHYAQKWSDSMKGWDSRIEAVLGKLYIGRNPKYPTYGSNCANFVSQCIDAGGVPQSTTWHATKEKTQMQWISGSGNYVVDYVKKSWNVTESWRLANGQYEYFSNPKNGFINGKVIKDIKNSNDVKTSLSKYKNIQPGDLLYFLDKDGKVEHATIITTVENNDIYFAGNTRRRFDYSLKESLEDSKYGGVFIIRMKDSFEAEGCIDE